MRVSRCVPQRCAGPSTQQKKMALDVDLNIPPSDCSHSNEVDTSTRVAAVPEVRVQQHRSQPPPVTIDLDTIDDDVVVLSSPRAFAEARNNSRRTRSRNNVIDLELESSGRDAVSNCNKRRRIPANQPIINCESYDIPERNVNSVNGYGRIIAPQARKFVAPPAPPPPPPPEPTFNCPICMGPLVEEVSTKCGHIFCKACLKKALSVQSKCPTCRNKVTMRGAIRVYLPKTS